jgi:hypothetical protein
MTHFEAYHWEDHVPRAGSWKFNLAAGLLALGLISAAFPDTYGNAPAAAAAARPTSPTSGASNQDMEISKALAPTVQPVNSWWVYCPTTATKYADS